MTFSGKIYFSVIKIFLFPDVICGFAFRSDSVSIFESRQIFNHTLHNDGLIISFTSMPRL